AVAGAGTVEYVSDWASCEFGEAFDRFYLGKSPLEDLSLYLRKSPVHQSDKVATPLLIFFGTEDRVVHPQQGWMQFRALQQPGKRYRLPNEAKAETLYEKSEAGENTLDAWAGYTVNPDDALVLRDKLKALPPGALLREVGQGRGSGKEVLVYDLGGNVAEWTQ